MSVGTRQAVQIGNAIGYLLIAFGCTYTLTVPVTGDHWFPAFWAAFTALGIRILFYVIGLFRRDFSTQYMFYGLEYCAGGELVKVLGGPHNLVTVLVVTGIVVLVTNYFKGPQPDLGYISRPEPQ